jgi:hypothetical protein
MSIVRARARLASRPIRPARYDEPLFLRSLVAMSGCEDGFRGRATPTRHEPSGSASARSGWLLLRLP